MLIRIPYRTKFLLGAILLPSLHSDSVTGSETPRARPQKSKISGPRAVKIAVSSRVNVPGLSLLRPPGVVPLLSQSEQEVQRESTLRKVH